MPDITITEPGRPGFYGPYIAGDSPQPTRPTSPWTLDTPGDFRVRLPLGIETATVELYGGGSCGVHGKAGTGGIGGGGGGYAKAALGTPFFLSGSVLEITVGHNDDHLTPTGGGDSTVSVGGVLGATGGGSVSAGLGGVGTVAAVAGVTSVSVADGGTGSNNVGTTGGLGGTAAGPAGGAGGAGGASGVRGKDGSAPGGGGGGNGSTVLTEGGNGAKGRVVITWP